MTGKICPVLFLHHQIFQQWGWKREANLAKNYYLVQGIKKARNTNKIVRFQTTTFKVFQTVWKDCFINITFFVKYFQANDSIECLLQIWCSRNMTNVSKRDVHENGSIYSYNKSRPHLLIWRQNVGMGLPIFNQL